jgi:hypothetical protein
LTGRVAFTDYQHSVFICVTDVVVEALDTALEMTVWLQRQVLASDGTAPLLLLPFRHYMFKRQIELKIPTSAVASAIVSLCSLQKVHHNPPCAVAATLIINIGTGFTGML